MPPARPSAAAYSRWANNRGLQRSDARGNAANAKSFVLTVHDTIAPTIDTHPDVSAEATGPAGAVVPYTSPTTHDIVDGGGTATCVPASGSTFALARRR